MRFYFLNKAPLPEMFGRPSTQPGLLPANSTCRLCGPKGEKGGAEPAG